MHTPWCIVMLCALATPAIGQGENRREMAGLIHQHLSSRYTIRTYQLDDQASGQPIQFTLDDGQILTYDENGRLLMRQKEDGRQIVYEYGYPVKILSQEGEEISRTQYTRTPQGHLARSITTAQEFYTERFYDARGIIRLEIQRQPQGYLSFRRGFYWLPGGRNYAYFETQSRRGETHVVVVDAKTGLVQEQLRLNNGITPNWQHPYRVFVRQVWQRMRGDLSDPLKQRRDSFNQTRDSLLFSRVRAEDVYPLKRFVQDWRQGKITFAEDWRYIDCHQIELTFPRLELVPLEKTVVNNVWVKGKRILVWNKKSKSWDPYPFNPLEEKLIPEGLRENYRIEPRYERNRWQVVAGKTETVILNTRLIVPEQEIEDVRLRLAQNQYFKQDEDDLRVELHNASRPADSPAAHSSRTPVLDMSPTWGRELSSKITGHVKTELQNLPQWRQRDDRQRTRAESILHLLTPDKVLPWEELLRQKKQFTGRPAAPPLEQIYFDSLTVHVPQIRKKKIYKILQPIRYHQGALNIWEKDREHPDQGYWKPYVLRPKRDQLIQQGNEFVIQLDEDRFEWAWTGGWEPAIFSGMVVIARPSKELREKSSGHPSDSSRPTPNAKGYSH